MRAPPLSTLSALAFWLAASLTAAPGPKAPLEPMDQALLAYQRAVKKVVAPDINAYQALRKGAPRTVIRWRGEAYRFPPLPAFEPSLDELRTTFALAALPHQWVGKMNGLGSQLFRHGMNDGSRGQIGKLWKSLAPELSERDVDRVDMPEMGEVFPGYSAKRKYHRIKPPFDTLKTARARALQALAAIPRSARKMVLELQEDDPHAAEAVAAMQAHEKAAKILTQTLREKALGQVMALLIKLQGDVHGGLEAKLGRAPKGDDIKRFAKLVSKRWRQQVRWNHARQYFAGYRATKNMTGGGTGDGTSGGDDEPIPGGGTGSGTGGTMVGSGTGNGAPPEGGVPGGGTGDGALSDEGGGTGTGEG